MNANMDVTNHTSKFFHSNKLTPSLFFLLSFFTFYIHHSRFHAIITQWFTDWYSESKIFHGESNNQCAIL